MARTFFPLHSFGGSVSDCYAYTGRDLLEDQVQQLYRRTDIVQMSRYFTIEVAQSANHLSSRYAGFPL